MSSFIKRAINQFKLFGKSNSDTAPDSVNVLAEYKSSRNVPSHTKLCLAPWTSISFTIDGYANICCLNKKTSVKIAGKSIMDVWKSEAFTQLRKHVEDNDLNFDCTICMEQIKSKNFSGVKAAGYDAYYPPDIELPKVMEFCLENTCNLACIMCNSVLSSTIRKNQKLLPLKKYYDDNFIKELDEFIPHLKEAIFSGGEPFLTPLYFKIWENMLALNPRLKISVVTNGTTLNDNIKNMMERGRFNINVSIDSVDKITYESIRKNADFDIVMKNFEWFRDYGKRKGLPVNIPVCPIISNWHNIPDIVRFANNNNVSINFVYVERPSSLSLTTCNPEFLNEIISCYRSELFEASSSVSEINIKRFIGLIDDIEKWKENRVADTDNYSQNKLMLSWEEKIMLNDNIVKTTNNPNAQPELILLIKNALKEVPEENRGAVINLLNKFSDDRFYEFMKGKTPREIALVFLEFAGK